MYNSLRKLFSHIQNARASASRSAIAEVNKTKAAIAVLNVLCQSRHIRGYRFNIRKPGKIEVLLSFAPVTCLVLPTPKKTYVKWKNINKASGAQIVSTSKGIMSGVNAYKLKVGGELICSIL